MAKGDAKTKAAKKMLEAEESSPSKVSMGQIRAAEEEQRMGRRGMDTGKKKKKIPSDPIEHIRTLYGTGKPNDKVKKARKKLYDRYVEQGKLEPIHPVFLHGLIGGERVPKEHMRDRNIGLSFRDRLARFSDKQSAESGRELDEYVKTGKSHLDDLESVRRNKQSDPYIAQLLKESHEEDAARTQEEHEKHQESRLGNVSGSTPTLYKETPDTREYTEELMAWRRKHGKKGKK
jgi:hypothetical protein